MAELVANLAPRRPLSRVRLTFLLVWLILLLVLTGMVTFPRDESGYDAARAAQVEKNMSEAEVEGIFGGSASSLNPPSWVGGNPRNLGGTGKFWYCDDGCVEVRFDDDGKVLGWFYHRHWHSRQSPFMRQVRRALRMIGF
jgi:hypothetical protein